MGDETVKELKYVGPATADVLADASFGAEEIREKVVSFRMLTDAGVNPGVAARIRREHSLAWSFESEGEDLRRRSSQVRGLGDAERAWVAASSGDWQEQAPPSEESDAEAAWVAAAGDGASDTTTKTDGSGDPAAAETAWQERSRPTPVGALDGVSPTEAADLAEAGITSARALASANPEEVADALDRDVERVATLCEAAAESVE